jgi:hypothetical protein
VANLVSISCILLTVHQATSELFSAATRVLPNVEEFTVRLHKGGNGSCFEDLATNYANWSSSEPYRLRSIDGTCLNYER